jgi:hypothetical protein
MPLSAFLAGLVSWLRAGYPAGIPEHDWVPLLALLSRRLSEQEVSQVADALDEAGVFPIEKADIAVMITKMIDEMPSTRDIDRVRARLDSAPHRADPPQW